MSLAVSQSFLEELNQVRDAHLYRSLRELSFEDSVHAYRGNKKILLFCGNDYLGFAHHPLLKEAAQKAAGLFGVGAGASRLISGHTSIHAQLERTLAALKRKEACLVYSAGYLANLGALTALAGEKDLIVMDKLCHASLIDGAKLSGATLRIFPHKNYERCETLVSQAQDFRRTLLVSDTVFSMDGDLADFEKLIAIKKKYHALLVLDDAHGTGVFGYGGGGVLEDVKLEADVDMITGTLSKALGSQGGFVAGSKEMIDYLINFSRPFIFATGLAPHICATVLRAISMLEKEYTLRQKLWRNVQILHENLKEMGFQLPAITSPIIPIILGEESKALSVSEALFDEGFFVPAIRYPTVSKGKARLRATLSAAHTEAEIRNFGISLRRVLKAS